MIGPLMTLVDTAFLGLTSTTTQQASLSAASLLVDLPLLGISFLSLATTASVVHAANQASSTEEYMEELRAGLHAPLYVALLCGAVLFTLANGLGPVLLSSLNINTETLPYVLRYVDIRAWCLPVQSVIMVLQTLFLSRLNALTPFLLAAAATALNIVLDFLACYVLDLGIAGVAAATAVSQVLLLGGMVWGTRRAGMLPDSLTAPHFRVLESVFKYFKHSWGPVLRVARMALMTGFTAVFLGNSSMAALQITLSMFLFLDLIGQSLHQSAQVMIQEFLPGGTHQQHAGMMIQSLLVTGLLLGLWTALIGCGLPVGCSWIFTSDVEVVSTMRSCVGLLATCYLLSPIAEAMTGVLLAANQIHALVMTQMVAHAAMLVFLVDYTRFASWFPSGLSLVWGSYALMLAVHLIGCGAVLALKQANQNTSNNVRAPPVQSYRSQMS